MGKLQYACKVVRPGRTFLCRMLELLIVVETSTLGEDECSLQVRLVVVALLLTHVEWGSHFGE